MRAPRPKLVGLDQFPGAAASIRRARSGGGLLGFAAAFLASHLGGAGAVDACQRSLVAGILAYLVFWAAAVGVWRAVVAAEARRAGARMRTAGRRT